MLDGSHVGRIVAGFVIVVLMGVTAFGQTTRPSTRSTTRRAMQREPKTYYVAPAGDDANPGTAEKPFRTIQKAAEIVDAPDTVKIAEGVYRERVALQRSGRYFGRFIRFEGAGPEKTIIDAKDLPGWGRGIFDTNGQDYLVLSGIGVQNGNSAGFSISGSWQVAMENCRSFNTTDSGIKIDKSGTVSVKGCEIEKACWHGGEESISVKRSQDVIVQGCHIHDTGHEGIDVKEGSKHVRVIGNHIHGTQAQGLYAEAWDSPTTDIRFENNRVHDCLFGVAAGSECGGQLSDVWFVNNLIYNNKGPGMIAADWGARQFKHPVKDVHFIHNTVCNNGRGGAEGTWGGGMVFENVALENVVVTNNILSQNPSGQMRFAQGKRPISMTVKDNLIDGESEQIGENISGAVKFVDAEHGDFTIETAPAGIKAGAKVSEVVKP
jgi:Right handed beta helix region/Pel9A-like, right handed beta helix region